MALTTTAEQEALRDVMRAYLAKFSSEDDVRKVMDGDLGYDPRAWTALAEQIGVQALAIPEQYGGGGFGFDDLAVVMEEAGRTLFPAPLLSTVVLSSSALLLSGDEQACATFLPQIASGELISTVAVAEKKAQWQEDDIQTVARRSGASWRLTGAKPYVLDGFEARLLIVAARTDAGVSLFGVNADAAGVGVDRHTSMDMTRRHSAVTLEDTQADLLGKDGNGWPVLKELYDRALVALAAEQVGGAAAVLDSTIDYLRLRHQFGRPIGSFQAIKHRCADLLVELESARSAAAYAIAAISSGADDVAVAASIAKTYCSRTFYHVAAESIQMHGGIGFTWEHQAHLYFKRAKSSDVLFGSPAFHRERIAKAIGLFEGGALAGV
ncbi:acyl-CoA dehydrogenase family protein [Williamsia sp. DF01-3]|uniref:acyl-CoA dehydrogenase family protein n=1 Tax=Williamsia sp. DF01-3 TaxID=2934157 RepID=UPI001FF5A49B|nr:acyl-CoA dehydrogenase family protein [Williamsia sp. DF01-3]MCK0517380.1 acyl-CoA/acyl-ACP dehydrogenase [Williamsia sp. DF01-3]